ncbi:hypothetical protein JTB14_015478 [Gonioctena quinquepunctata]|nr:hypothetical protein JTB14_015478 [Gonioctena quinquepunctata]
MLLRPASLSSSLGLSELSSIPLIYLKNSPYFYGNRRSLEVAFYQDQTFDYCHFLNSEKIIKLKKPERYSEQCSTR